MNPAYAVAGAESDDVVREGSSAGQKKEVEYILPYPGILPDNPLFFLKNVRDRIIELMISDPVNKGEFYILQADKKLNTGILLSEKGKARDARHVFSEALSYRVSAVETLVRASEKHTSIPGYVAEKLLLSLRKHREVLSGRNLPVETLETLLEKADALSF